MQPSRAKPPGECPACAACAGAPAERRVRSAWRAVLWTLTFIPGVWGAPAAAQDSAAAASGVENPSENQASSRGQLLVKFRAGTTDNERDRIHAEAGARLLRRFQDLRIDHVALPQGLSVTWGTTFYGALPAVEYAEPVRPVEAQ